MSEQRNRVKVQHIRSNKHEDVVAYEDARIVAPKLPGSEKINDGEIAVNFGAGVESLSIKNSEDKVVRFTNEKELNDVSEVAAMAINELDGKIEKARIMDEFPQQGSKKAVESGGLYEKFEDKQNKDFIVNLVGFGVSGEPDKSFSQIEESIAEGRRVVLKRNNEEFTMASHVEGESVAFSLANPGLGYVVGYVIDKENTATFYSTKIDDVVDGKLVGNATFCPGEWVEGVFVADESNPYENNEKTLYIDVTSNKAYRFQGSLGVTSSETAPEEFVYKEICVTDISGKQDNLVSGENIKTVNNVSLLGSGNIDADDVVMGKLDGVKFYEVTSYSGTGVPTFSSTAYPETTEGSENKLFIDVLTGKTYWCNRSKLVLLGQSRFIELNNVDISGKQDVLTFDSEPTEGSTNPVTSGGVFERFAHDSLVSAAALNDLNTRIGEVSQDVSEMQPGRLVVTFTPTEEEGIFECDTTPSEIYTAFTEGREVIGKRSTESRIYHLSNVNPSECTFVYGNADIPVSEIAYVNSMGYWIATTVGFDSEPATGSYNVPTSDAVAVALSEKQPSRLVVTFTPTEEEDIYDCDTTPSEIYTAFTEGREVIGKRSEGNRIYHLSNVNQSECTFVYGNADIPVSEIAYVNSMDRWQAMIVGLDSEPTSGSPNVVTSDGVYSSLETKADKALYVQFTEVAQGSNELTCSHTFEQIYEAYSEGRLVVGQFQVIDMHLIACKENSYMFNGMFGNRTAYVVGSRNIYVTPQEEHIGVQYIDLQVQVDSTPTSGSTNAVSSGGVYQKFSDYSQVISASMNDLETRVSSLEEENILLRAEIERIKNMISNL